MVLAHATVRPRQNSSRHLPRSSKYPQPVPLPVGVADDPQLANPKERLRRLSLDYLGIIFEYGGVLTSDGREEHWSAWRQLAYGVKRFEPRRVTPAAAGFLSCLKSATATHHTMRACFLPLTLLSCLCRGEKGCANATAASAFAGLQVVAGD